MIPDISGSYDRIPYEGHAYGVSHPDAIAVAASLSGIQPPRLDRCRILEIGCAAGNNIFPLAAAFPNSEFVGIDLSSVQIKQGHDMLAGYGLKNLQLLNMSVMDLPQSLGKFDYIISHGVWSWVPPAVQDGILKAANDFLAPGGLVYISYNVFPGWNWRAYLRDIMVMHGKHFAEPEEKVKAGREFLTVLAASFPETNKTPFAIFLREEAERMKKLRDPYVIHEYLETFNIPVYFREFMARAEAVGLQFVAESRVQTMALGLLAKPVADTIRKLNLDAIEREQYIDFARNRTFRETVLCHKNVTLERRITAESIKKLDIACAAVPEKPITDFKSNDPVRFKWASGQTIDVTMPVFKVALACMAEMFPVAISFPDLIKVINQKLTPLGQPVLTVAEDSGLSNSLLDAYLRSLIELHFQSPAIASKISDMPVSFPLARKQAETVDQVISLRHTVIHLSPFARSLIKLLDGTRNRAALVEAIFKLIEKGVLNIKSQDPEVLTSRAKQQELVEQTISRDLEMFRRSSLLSA